MIYGPLGKYSFDTTGQEKIIQQAFSSLYKNGECVIAVAYDDIKINGMELILGKSIRGTLEGQSNPRQFIPHLISLYQAGKLPIDRLVKYYDFDNINKALDDAKNGKTIKPILLFK